MRPLDPSLQSTFLLLERAFPAGIAPGDYFPLLSVLDGEEISSRNLAEVLAAMDGQPYAVHYYNLLHELPSRRAQPSDIDRVRRVLEANGLDAWRKEPD